MIDGKTVIFYRNIFRFFSLANWNLLITRAPDFPQSVCKSLIEKKICIFFTLSV